MVYFSILIYTYKRKEHLIGAVRSALAQKYNRENYEIVVVKGFEDTQIDEQLDRMNVRRIYFDEKSLGAKISAGLKECKGDFVCLLDDDDEFESSKLTVLDRIIGSDSSLDFIHDSIVKINETGSVIDNNPSENIKNGIQFSPDVDHNSKLSSMIRHRVDWYLSCMSFRRSTLSNVLDELTQTYQSIDKFLFFSALNYGRKLALIPDRLTRYRLHESTTTYTGSKSNFFERRELFFYNTVKIFDNIVRISKGLDGERLANCQLIQHKINLYFISSDRRNKVSFNEYFNFILCLKYASSRYQFVWILAYLMRRLSLSLSRTVYYRYLTKSLEYASN
ncbi:Glycosyl transferase family 2 [Thermoplasmatales archaeon]|nr:Glycosyl transferase family 2 [Thermoplasmatales archaeon]